MPPARKRKRNRLRKTPLAAAVTSPVSPAAEGEAPSEAAEAGVRAVEETDGGEEMEAELEEEATVVEPEEAEEDPKETGVGVDEGERGGKVMELTVCTVDGMIEVIETDRVASLKFGDEETKMIMVPQEGGDEDTWRMEPVMREGQEDFVADDEEPEEAGEDEEDEPEEVDAEEPKGAGGDTEEEPQEAERPKEAEKRPKESGEDEGPETDKGPEREPKVYKKPKEADEITEKAGDDPKEKTEGTTRAAAYKKPKESDKRPEEEGDDKDEEPDTGEEPENVEEGGEVMEVEATGVLAEGATLNKAEKSEDEDTHGDNNKDRVSEGNDEDLEIYVCGLPKYCVEEDITMVFSQFGEIKSVRILKVEATKGTKKKNRGIAFIHYVNAEAAKKVLAEFKEGIEVKGKKVRISASQNNSTLYLGNICKSWTKDQVLDSLNSIGIEDFEMTLPDDPDIRGRNRGYAFLKFGDHENAKAAVRRLKRVKRPDAMFGIDRSVKVYFARPPAESSDDLLMKVKTVYLQHVPLSWDERKIEECCEGYGKVLSVHLYRKFKTSKKNIFFVEFSNRKSALACVEGINNTKIEGRESKLVASLARPPCKMQLAEKSAKVGFKVNSGATSSNADKSKNKKNRKTVVVVEENSRHKPPNGDKNKLTSQSEAEVPQISNCSRGKRKAGKSKITSVNERPSKKSRKHRDVSRRLSNTTNPTDPIRSSYAKQPAGNVMHRAGPRYANRHQANPSAEATSRSKPNARDLEPHAGYITLENRASNRVQSTHVYDHQRVTPHSVHEVNALPYTRVPQPAYSVYTRSPGYQGGYAYSYIRVPTSGFYSAESGSSNPQSGYY